MGSRGGAWICVCCEAESVWTIRLLLCRESDQYRRCRSLVVVCPDLAQYGRVQSGSCVSCRLLSFQTVSLGALLSTLHLARRPREIYRCRNEHCFKSVGSSQVVLGCVCVFCICGVVGSVVEPFVCILAVFPHPFHAWVSRSFVELFYLFYLCQVSADCRSPH